MFLNYVSECLVGVGLDVDMEICYEIVDLNEKFYQLVDLNVKFYIYDQNSFEVVFYLDCVEIIIDEIFSMVDVCVSYSFLGWVNVYIIGGVIFMEGDIVQDVIFNSGDGIFWVGD